VLPLFPLRGAILLPRATLALNVFEPRYLLLVDYALAGDRLIGILQPAPDAGEVESPSGKIFPLRRIGCAGRITSFSEGDDGRLMLSLTGIARFRMLQDVESDEPFRFGRVSFAEFATDFTSGHGEDDVDRQRLLTTLRNYLIANNLSADWDRIDSASNERLVNTLSILSPYGAEEKQALLEARDLKARAEALVALAEMELASRDDGSGTSIQ
jgi:Lon protease-like protein